jgi:hypothetical protein
VVESGRRGDQGPLFYFHTTNYQVNGTLFPKFLQRHIELFNPICLILGKFVSPACTFLLLVPGASAVPLAVLRQKISRFLAQTFIAAKTMDCECHKSRSRA